MNTDPNRQPEEQAAVTTSDLYPEGHPFNEYEQEQSPVFDYYEDERRAAIRAQAKKDMLYGALWCAGGTVLTLAHIGFIFWGAIVFGGIQFFRGVANYNN